MKAKKSLTFSLIVVYISIVALLSLAVALPWLVTWLVEVKHKNAGLPALIMLTCYPCLPFSIYALLNIKKVIKSCLSGLVFGDSNIASLKKVCLCSLAVAVITFVSAFFYPPFYVISLACAGCALSIKVTKDLFAAELEKRREELYETVREEL